MLLLDFLESYGLEHDVADDTISQYRYAVISFQRWLERPAKLRDLTDDNANRWIVERLKTHARATVKGQRGSLLTLWRAAYEDGKVRARPDRVRSVGVPQTNPDAWTMVEMRIWIDACEKLPGTFPCGVPRAAMMRAWLLTDWYSGLRPCDMRRLTSAHLSSGGLQPISQKKTGHLIVCDLPRECVDAIRATDPHERELVFPITKKAMFYWWKWLKARVNLPGTPKWVRRSGATAVEIAHPGSAMAFLGHRTPGLAYKHYVDRRQVKQNRPLPPRIA